MKQTNEGLKRRESELIASFLWKQMDYGFTFASISLAEKEQSRQLAEVAKRRAEKAIETVKHLIGMTSTEDACAIDKRLLELEQLLLKL